MIIVTDFCISQYSNRYAFTHIYAIRYLSPDVHTKEFTKAKSEEGLATVDAAPKPAPLPLSAHSCEYIINMNNGYVCFFFFLVDVLIGFSDKISSFLTNSK